MKLFAKKPTVKGVLTACAPSATLMPYRLVSSYRSLLQSRFVPPREISEEASEVLALAPNLWTHAYIPLLTVLVPLCRHREGGAGPQT